LNNISAQQQFALRTHADFAWIRGDWHFSCFGNISEQGSLTREAKPSMETIHDYAAGIGLSLGHRIHSMRESRDWTLETLSNQTGLSKAYLSRLEAGDRQPSLAALGEIARAFHVSIAALFEHPDESADCVVVRGGSTSSQAANGLSFVSLSSTTKPFNVHPIRVTIPAERPGGESYQHDGEEWLFVTRGRVKVSVNGSEHVLESGDSAHFDSRLPHRLDAMDGKDAQIILVACPIPLTLNQRRELAESEAVRFVG
jgi:DNA-binding XRE family transcriptional regulator/quercetin dioxygenase-like cupin family protein